MYFTVKAATRTNKKQTRLCNDYVVFFPFSNSSVSIVKAIHLKKSYYTNLIKMEINLKKDNGKKAG